MWVVKRFPCSSGAQRDIEGLAGFLHETMGALQYGKRGMAFIEMADFRLDAQCGQQSPSADPEEQFLLET